MILKTMDLMYNTLYTSNVSAVVFFYLKSIALHPITNSIGDVSGHINEVLTFFFNNQAAK